MFTTPVTLSANSIETACYGLKPIFPERLKADAQAVVDVLSAVESTELPPRDKALPQQFMVVHRMLSAVSSHADPAWFTMSEMFGHPAPELCQRLMQQLSSFSRAIKQQEGKRFFELVQSFDDNRGFEVLDSYLDVALRGHAPVAEENMAFILSLPATFSLRIGACDGTLRDFVANTIKDSGYSRQTIELLGAWLIHDVQEVQAAVSETFKSEATAGGSYFISETKAKPVVEAILKQTNNYILSPWHLDEEPPIG